MQRSRRQQWSLIMTRLAGSLISDSTHTTQAPMGILTRQFSAPLEGNIPACQKWFRDIKRCTYSFKVFCVVNRFIGRNVERLITPSVSSDIKSDLLHVNTTQSLMKSFIGKYAYHIQWLKQLRICELFFENHCWASKAMNEDHCWIGGVSNRLSPYLNTVSRGNNKRLERHGFR